MGTTMIRTMTTLLVWASLTHAQTLPSPTILSPVAGATEIALQPVFLWHQAEGATTYELQISTSAMFAELVENATGLVDTQFVPTNSLLPSTMYYWRVRSSDGTDFSAWSPSEQGSEFSTVPPIPSPPIQVSPSDGATDLRTLPACTWEPVNGATRYSIVLATDNLFSVVVYADTNITTTTYSPPAALSIATTYFWRVSALNAGGQSEWSPAWQFTTYASVPPAPVLLLPANLSTGIPTLPVFAWQSAPGADTYTVRLSPDSLFAGSVWERTGVMDTSITVPDPLDSALQYYWQVQGANSGGNGDWSTWWTFTVTGNPPSAPALLTPADNAIDIWPDTVLAWEAVLRSTGYSVQLSTDPSFASAILDTGNILTTSFRVSGLARDTRFYWHVRGANAVGSGEWSAIWSFVTVPDSPSAPGLVSPDSGAVEVPNPPTFLWHRAPRATTYEIQVAFRPDFEDDSLIVHETGLVDTTFSPLSILDGGTTLNWRIRGVNAGGAGAWSTGWVFTTKLEVPSSIALYAPENGATDRWPLVLLGWYACTDNPADSYRLQVSPDSLFRRTTIDVAGITGTERLVTGLAYSETYYWRANGTNRVGTGPWSEVWHFSTRAGAPRTPTLSSPADGATNVSLTPAFTWIPGGGEDSYQLQVALASNFSSTVVNASGIVDTIYTVTSPLQGSTVHYWRVRAVNASGNSSWTGVRSFTTLLPPPGQTVALPAENVTSTGFQARWLTVAGATSYRLDVAQDSLFTTYLTGYENASVADTFCVLAGLQPGTWYYYRVRAVHAGGTGPSSEVMRVLTLGVRVMLRAMLAGPVHGDTMITALRDDHVLPLTQPYSDAPWTYAGSEQVDSIPVRVVDWVLIEVRSDSVTMSGRRAAFMLADGTVTDLDGVTPVLFPGVISGEYYIVIRHRNHLAVMSSTLVPLTISSSVFDFTSGPDKYYKGQAKTLTGGLNCLIPGDATGNGVVVLASELTSIRSANLQERYDNADLNMDGAVVLATELTIVRENNLYESNVP